jgi:Flp pilus assembly protein TadG
MHLHRSRGAGMVEFALMVPIVFFLFLGSVDFFRLINANSTVADAARQGARQAVPAAASADTPWGASNGQPCSGTTFSAGATGQGCLTDARINEAVSHVLAPLTTNVTLVSALASACTAPATAGTAKVCIAPAQSGSAVAYATCAAAKTALGHDPQPGELGPRQPEWTTPKYQGCFLVQVTVVYKFKPLTPYGPTIALTSSTSMLAEY